MPKLSAIATGSIIQVPFGSDQLRSFIYLGYNKYGKSECLAMQSNIYEAPSLSVNSGVSVSTIEYSSYPGSFLDEFCMGAYYNSLNSAVARGLISIALTCSFDVVEMGETVVIQRPIFIPSQSEMESFGGSLFSTATFDISASMTPATFNSTYATFLKGLPGIGNYSATVSSINSSSSSDNISFNHKGVMATRDPYNGTMQNHAMPQLITWGRLSTNKSGPSYAPIITVHPYFMAGVTYGYRPIICLSGNTEVASSSGGKISKAGAVESYRKIDGVWYRTV